MNVLFLVAVWHHSISRAYHSRVYHKVPMILPYGETVCLPLDIMSIVKNILSKELNAASSSASVEPYSNFLLCPWFSAFSQERCWSVLIVQCLAGSRCTLRGR